MVLATAVAVGTAAMAAAAMVVVAEVAAEEKVAAVASTEVMAHTRRTLYKRDYRIRTLRGEFHRQSTSSGTMGCRYPETASGRAMGLMSSGKTRPILPTERILLHRSAGNVCQFQRRTWMVLFQLLEVHWLRQRLALQTVRGRHRSIPCGR